MPYRLRADRQRRDREYQRNRDGQAPPLFDLGAALATAPDLPADPAGAIATWAEDRLTIPTGRLRGRPFAMPQWQRDFLAGLFASREAWLTCARKNGKSGAIAAVILAHLAKDGPMLQAGWRGLVISLTGTLAGELRRQVDEIIQASALTGVRVMKSPAPGRILGALGSTVDILAADKSSGHAAGADLAIIDEAGLLPERKRPLWDAVASSVSGRDGRLCGISVLGHGPMFREALAREGEPGVHVVRFEAPADCGLDDPRAWAAANPGLATGIKSPDYMAHKAREALSNPSSAAGFRSLDLNQPIKPADELLCDVAEWQRVECPVSALPAREGACWLGIDLGMNRSLTAAVAVWETGRMEAWAAVPRIPDLLERGRKDGVGMAYQDAVSEGSLAVVGERMVDWAAFLTAVFAHLPAGVVVGADKRRRTEVLHALETVTDDAPSVVWRHHGASATPDTSHDVRAFQSAVAGAAVRCAPNRMMRLALAGTAVRRDGAGNPAIDKSSHVSRIDLASAAVIACGLRAVARRRPEGRQAFVIAG